jgi:hypothetical protein
MTNTNLGLNLGKKWNCSALKLVNRGHILSLLISRTAWNTVDRGFESRSCQTKVYKTGICCFSGKHSALRNKSKDWLSLNQDSLSKWSNRSTRGRLFLNQDSLSKWSNRSTRGLLFLNQDSLSKWSNRSTRGLLFLNQDSLSKWSNRSTRGLLFHHWASTIKIQLSVLV